MRTLLGVGVLVTRPTAQAATLSELLQQRGAAIWALSALDIIATPAAYPTAPGASSAADVDLVIFTSANAVRFGVMLLEGMPRTLAIAAIGPATARALRTAGYRSTLEPLLSIDSEGLLAHPQLMQVSGQKVLLIKGVGGRGVLTSTLAARGALVTCIDVYERRPTKHSALQLKQTAQRIATGDIHVVTATSLEIAAHLLHCATAELRAGYERVHWLVPGLRVAQGIRALGCQAPLIQAESAEDHELVASLERWRNGASTA